MTAEEAVSEDAVSAVYKSAEELEKQIMAFTKEYAKKSERGEVLGEIKRKCH